MTSKNYESGRSMVEMLGTLAIIGVLSIGGIMGYSYAMDKYRANETINDVNLRAMDLISQLTQGTTPTLASWEETGTVGYPISLHTDESTTNHYIKVEKVPFRVCDIISNTMPESVVIEINNDTEQCANGENVMYFAYEGFDEGMGDNAGLCPAGTSVEGLGGYAGTTDSAGNQCYCINVDTKWDSTISSCVPKDGTCLSYTDCDKDEFCILQSETSCGISQCAPTHGTCENLNRFGESLSTDQFWLSDYSGYWANWWTAQDICAAKGMRMVSLKDLGCENTKNDICTSDTLGSILQPFNFWTTDLGEDYEPNTAFVVNPNGMVALYLLVYGSEIPYGQAYFDYYADIIVCHK